ncbi:MAG: ChbG/HpnK family deacetylase [Vicinamibacteria bacterium]
MSRASSVASPHVVNIADLRLAAKRRLPRAVFDYIDGGADREITLRDNCAAFDEVPSRAGDFDIGIHLTLTCEAAVHRWGPVADARDVPSLVDAEGCFVPDVETLARRADPREVEREITAQIDSALGAGLRPTHLDSHMFALFRVPALSAVLDAVAQRYDLPAVNPFRRKGVPETVWAPRVTLASLVDHDDPVAGATARAARGGGGLVGEPGTAGAATGRIEQEGGQRAGGGRGAGAGAHGDELDPRRGREDRHRQIVVERPGLGDHRKAERPHVEEPIRA